MKKDGDMIYVRLPYKIQAVAGGCITSGEALSRILANLYKGNLKGQCCISSAETCRGRSSGPYREAFFCFMDQLYGRFTRLLESTEVAENLGALGAIDHVHVPEFVDVIWVAVSDPTLASLNGQWKLWVLGCLPSAAQAGLGKNAPVYSIHGSLLSVGELLRNSSEFMMSRYRDLADILLVYMEHKHRLVHLSTASLLPHIAHFQRDCFIANHLKHNILASSYSSLPTWPCCKLLKAERANGFIALGEMVGALDGELVHYPPTIVSYVPARCIT
ncbi:hypothetical protein C5167_048982 [Papaver somniferum]|uniref:Uncharacterized protein n=1 Tax=Papaver somniferum TaxID=3469 RepID=A0A4Y7KNP0_PAPSO|nr:hypothetical protein C5167_048982 [Papaver somniferum]